MKRLSVKYLAGLVDGEGCIDWCLGFDKKYNKRYIRPRVRITLAKPGYDVVDLLVNNFKGNVEVRTPNNPNHLESKTWYVTGTKAVAFLNNIKSSLIIKKEQAKFAIAWEKYLKGSHVEDDLKDALKEEMKLMKKDPHRLSEKAVIKIKESLKR